MSNNEQQTKAKRTPRGMYKKPGALLLTAAIIIVGAWLTLMLILPKGERINTNGYQVVYMATGQAYFGKLQNTEGTFLVLKNPYTAEDVKPEGTENVKTSTTLVKISQQQYGPEDTMSLRGDQVLFWQNLRDDSKVTQAIKNAS